MAGFCPGRADMSRNLAVAVPGTLRPAGPAEEEEAQKLVAVPGIPKIWSWINVPAVSDKTVDLRDNSMNLAWSRFWCYAVLIPLVLAARAASGVEQKNGNIAQIVLKGAGATPALCAHVDAGDGSLCVKLARGGARFVHGICMSREDIERARVRIRAEGQAGRIGVEYAPPGRLFYSDGLLNALVFSGFSKWPDPGVALAESLRVLAYGGYAYLYVGQTKIPAIRKLLAAKSGSTLKTERMPDGWVRVLKPRSSKLDEWTHLQYGPESNPVSHDTEVGVPNGVRWLAAPLWPFGGRKTVVRGTVSAGGRLFYMHEDSPSAPGKYPTKSLVARDAFNGLLLWKRESSGESLLVADNATVWHVLKRRGPLVALDSATGKVKRTYDKETRIRELIQVDGMLIVKRNKVINCISGKTGVVKWTAAIPAASGRLSRSLIHSTELVTGEGQVFFLSDNPVAAVSLNLANGKKLWQSGQGSWKTGAGSSSRMKPKLCCYYEKVLFLANESGGNIIALSAKDGSFLWSYAYPQIKHGGTPVKVIGMDGLLWIHKAGKDRRAVNVWEGLDPVTGTVKKSVPEPANYRRSNITERCYRDRATANFVLTGTMYFVDLKRGKFQQFRGARPACGRGGVLPANGMVYTFPHGCACLDVIRGFLGLTSKRRDLAAGAASRRETGPAISSAAATSAEADSWPTYRGNAFRGSSRSAVLPADLKLLWSVSVAENYPAEVPADWQFHGLTRITSPTVAGGRVFVSAPDLHLLTALDARGGKVLWTYSADGRIDTPPTLYRGLCLFGCRNGWIYGLEAASGRLAWRFRAAPSDERIAAYGQLESPWPVAGGVLIFDNRLFAAAGRHGLSDGGIRLCALDPATGKLQWEQNLTDGNLLADLIIAGDKMVSMGKLEFDPKTGAVTRPSKRLPSHFIPGRLSLTDSAWYKHGYGLRRRMRQWSLGPSILGTLLAFNQKAAYGFISGFGLSVDDKHIEGAGKLFAKPLGNSVEGGWKNTLPKKARIKSLVIAGKTLIAAGIPSASRQNDAFIWLYSAENGKKIGELKLDSAPVHEGLAVAGKRLYVSTDDGKVSCYGK